MKYIVNFLRFWYDFIVGDDWRLAAGVIIGLALCWYFRVWWLMPPAVTATLSLAVRKAIKK